MTIRERLEQQEYMLLAPNAQKAAETKGRLYPAEENEVRTCYQRDADRIVPVSYTHLTLPTNREV